MEATGGHEAALIAQAANRGMLLYRLRGDRVSAHATASGRRAKTDRLDAQAIADFVRVHHAKLKPFVPLGKTQTELAKHVARRDELVAMRAAEKNRLKAPDYDLCKADIEAHIAFLTRQIDTLEAAVSALIDADADLKNKAKVLTAIKGVGEITANALLAAMPELGLLTGKQIASLAGLAPYVRQSGARTGYRKTGRGRSSVRKALFMAALTAKRWNPKIAAFYDRLIENGKKPMVAIIACARKLLVIANAKIRDSIAVQQS